MSVRDAIRQDLGLALEIGDGDGSRKDPIQHTLVTPQDAARTELLTLRALGQLRGIFWRTTSSEFFDDPDGLLVQRKIETKQLTKDQVINQIENYYFRRIPQSKSLSAEHLSTEYIVRQDGDAGLSFPYEISWLHSSEIPLDESYRSNRGYSLYYAAPGMKAHIYVYESDEEISHRQELEKALGGVLALHGKDSIEHDWGVLEKTDHCMFCFIPRFERGSTSCILVTSIRGHYVKARISFQDDFELRAIFNDFCACLLTLVRGKRS